MVQKILEIKEELVMIEKHKREHTKFNNDATNTCIYCRRRQQLAAGQETKVAFKAKKKARTSSEIERMVDASGRNAHVSVPRSWAGKRVKIVLLDD